MRKDDKVENAKFEFVEDSEQGAGGDDPLSTQPPEVVDPLEALLAAPAELPEARVYLPRLRSYWRVKALDGEEHEEILRQCTREVQDKKTRLLVRRTDQVKFGRLLVFHATVEPNLRDKRLLEKFRVNPAVPEEVVVKALLPGEIDELVDKILELTGFNVGVIEQARNL